MVCAQWERQVGKEQSLQRPANGEHNKVQISDLPLNDTPYGENFGSQKEILVNTENTGHQMR